MSSTTMTAENIPGLFLDAFEEGFVWAVSMFFNAVVSMLAEHILVVVGVFVFLLIIFTVMALLGDWSALGSLLYNSIYFGLVLLIGLIWGPETLVSDLYKFLAILILNPVVYYSVGWILRKTGLK